MCEILTHLKEKVFVFNNLLYFLSVVLFIGAELFAKRRKRSEKWVVGETNGTQPPTPADLPPSPAPVVSPLPPASTLPPPSYLPETAQRVQHNQKLDEIQVILYLI